VLREPVCLVKTNPCTPRLLCFSAYSQNLRARAIVRFLAESGYKILQPQSHGPPGSVTELALTLIPYCWSALTTRADLAVGFKPHLNVTLPLLLCKLRGITTWLDIDDLDHAYRDNWISRVVEFVEKPFPHRFSIVSYHNELLEDYLLDDLGCKPSQLLRIEQGVDCPALNSEVPATMVAETRQRLAAEGRLMAVYIAHLNLASDLEPVLKAWQKVIPSVPDALLVIVGGGPRQEYYETMAQLLGLEQHVKFIGEVPHGEVRAYLALAEIALLFFSPRKVNAYRCSLKLREYFAAGLKVICNNFGELKQYAHLTYQSGSEVQEFAATIIHILQSGGDGRECEAREFARRHLDWRTIVSTAADEIAHRAGLTVQR
jgi:glycosyltransferase involved in cell wall biosynthesis